MVGSLQDKFVLVTHYNICFLIKEGQNYQFDQNDQSNQHAGSKQ